MDDLKGDKGVGTTMNFMTPLKMAIAAVHRCCQGNCRYERRRIRTFYERECFSEPDCRAFQTYSQSISFDISAHGPYPRTPYLESSPERGIMARVIARTGYWAVKEKAMRFRSSEVQLLDWTGLGTGRNDECFYRYTKSSVACGSRNSRFVCCNQIAAGALVMLL